MANSMTGYGIGSVATDNNLLTVEIKAVNHRFLEVYVRLPKAMIALEDRVKKLVQNRLSRGKLDILVTLEQVSAKKVSVTVDNELAIAYYNSLAELALNCGLSSEISLIQLASFPGVLTVEKPEADGAELTQLLTAAMAQALDALTVMRQVEGQALAEDLEKRIGVVAGYVAEINECAYIVVEEQSQRLQSRIADILGDVTIDESRLANEVAFFA
ncbi:MAG: YicC/YloC family endoribonuclease, partial [Clostridiales bacterium]